MPLTCIITIYNNKNNIYIISEITKRELRDIADVAAHDAGAGGGGHHPGPRRPGGGGGERLGAVTLGEGC